MHSLTNEGLGANWATRRAFWANRPACEGVLRNNLLSLATRKTRHIGDDANVEICDPGLWTDYRTIVDAFPKRRVWAFRLAGIERQIVLAQRTRSLSCVFCIQCNPLFMRRLAI
jgi:hypothetical protein